MKSNKTGHFAALFTIIIWGTTFISTKVLLADFKPIEILFYRFIMGYVALFAIYPRRLKDVGARRELIFAAAGLCGVCMYYLLENIALTYTLASDTGVIISSAPFFTAIFSCIFSRGAEKPRARFFVGFAAAMAGIALISFGGGAQESGELGERLFGDFLALLAAAVWGLYSILTKKISAFGYPTIPATRRTFFYGIIFMIPALFIFDFEFKPALFAEPKYLLNMLFLGLLASALCFVSWSFSVGKLGAVAASVYIYAVPVVTLIASALILGERVTPCALAGAALTIAGLFIGGKAPEKTAAQNKGDNARITEKSRRIR